MIIDGVALSGQDLAGQVAVVTGAGQGIGRETARVLARLGARVALAEIRETGRETESLVRREGGEALFVACDVADEESVAAAADRVIGAYGRVDILVNNAIALSVKPLLDHTALEWDRVMAVNLRGAFLAIRAFLPDMLARRHGVVVTMESADGMPFIAPYLATKAGLRSLALSLGQEVGEGSGVSVYAFAPGLVDTPGLADALRALAPRLGHDSADFVAQSGLPLIPAELSATGLVGTILHAREFHAREATYVDGLGVLGLDPRGQPLAPPESGADANADANAEPGAVGGPADAADADGPDDVVALNRSLENVLRLYAREFRELNVLMRPVAKRMFRQDTGRTVEEWLSAAETVTRNLERDAFVDRADYLARLTALDDHIAKQEASVPTWISDEQALELALASLRERRGTIAALRAALGRR